MDLIIIGAVLGWLLTVLAQDLAQDWKSWKESVITPVEKWKEEHHG